MLDFCLFEELGGGEHVWEGVDILGGGGQIRGG